MQLGIFGYYSIKKEYIVEKLCINKDKPQLHCDGKCYLGKQLKTTEEGAKNSAAKIQKEKDEVLQDVFHQVSLTPRLNISFHGHLADYTFNIPTAPVFGVAHPPA